MYKVGDIVQLDPVGEAAYSHRADMNGQIMVTTHPMVQPGCALFLKDHKIIEILVLTDASTTGKTREMLGSFDAMLIHPETGADMSDELHEAAEIAKRERKLHS